MVVSRDQRLVLVIAILSSFVSFLDSTVVNVALRAIKDELGGGLTTQQWAVDGYLITLGALILVAGSVSDAYGRILVLRIGLIGFGIASIGVALALTSPMLIGARLVQGIAGALLVPSSLALITSNFRGAAQARAIGIWTAATTGAMIAGPLIGGVFVDLVSWRLAFLINVLPIAAVLWLLVVLGHTDRRSEDARIHWLDAALCTLGLGSAVFALIEQPNYGWGSPRIWVPLVLGVAVFSLFLVRQRVVPSPMLPLSLFRVRNFSTGNVATMFIYGALSLNGFAMSIFLLQEAGLSATLSGAAMLPATVVMVVLSSRVGALAGRWGARPFMTVGPLVMAAGALLLLLVRPRPEFDYWLQVLPATLVFGLGLTLTVSPLTSAILGAIESSRSGVASAVNNAVSRVAGLVVVAVIAFIAGGEIDPAGFRRSVIVTAVLLALGGVVSFLGIRTTASTEDEAEASPAAGSAPAAGEPA